MRLDLDYHHRADTPTYPSKQRERDARKTLPIKVGDFSITWMPGQRLWECQRGDYKSCHASKYAALAAATHRMTTVAPSADGIREKHSVRHHQPQSSETRPRYEPLVRAAAASLGVTIDDVTSGSTHPRRQELRVCIALVLYDELRVTDEQAADAMGISRSCLSTARRQVSSSPAELDTASICAARRAVRYVIDHRTAGASI